jgi:dGTPase
MTVRPTQPAELASYAVADEASRGRVHADALPAGQSPFEFDRTRILNCMAFRRLMHKTQVFVTEGGDHFRTRLTHTLEVAAQAQRVARLLRLNVGLAGAIALAHDLGHPPFGHAGEVALAALTEAHGGFEHNLQSLRVVDYLEHPYPAFRGLNLTFELRESLIKHRTRYDKPDSGFALDEHARPLLEAGPMPSLEGQAANLADTIAYTLHDIEDALTECGLTEDALNRCAVWRAAAQGVRKQYPSQPLHAVRRPILDEIAGRLVEDAAAESQRRIAAAQVVDPDAARRHDGTLIAFSREVGAGIEELQTLLTQWVYRNHRVIRMDSKARRLIRELFGAYLAEPDLLPPRFASRVPDQGPHRVTCDYIAGMTDRFCQQEHRRLYGPSDFG